MELPKAEENKLREDILECLNKNICPNTNEAKAIVISKVVNKYIKEACKEQRKVCSDVYYQMSVIHNNYKASTNNKIEHAELPTVWLKENGIVESVKE